ncbi:MAG TPA: efflux RND transporter periplasmic adaptor subunit [Verrucomicrobiae bacterium]|jgi:HlyD family secretion protein
MNQDKLQQLHIESGAKQRSHAPLWAIFLGVVIVAAVAVFFMWPRASDKVRVFAGAGEHRTTSEDAAPKPKSTASAAGKSQAATVANPAPSASGRVENSVLTVTGYIINRERIELSPRFLGVVKWIGVKKGDAVTNGQVVVLLDDAEYRARLAEIEGRLASAKVGVVKAELDFKRAKELVSTKVEMQKTEDDARLQLEAMKAQVNEVQGAIQLIKTYLDWCIIRSPIDGVVLEKLVDPNELVVPQSFGGTRGPSTALISVADLKDLQVEIELNEADLSKVSLNQKCRISPEAYLDKSYEGYVAEIAPEANRQKGTLQIKVQIKDPDKFLTPELSAKVDFLKDAAGGK